MTKLMWFVAGILIIYVMTVALGVHMSLQSNAKTCTNVCYPFGVFRGQSFLSRTECACDRNIIWKVRPSK